jgi:predicted nucleic acid-binding protein
LAGESEPLVINTGPLIALTNGGVVEQLGRLPFRYFSTPQVRAEVMHPAAARALLEPGGLITVEAVDGPLDAALLAQLDVGETSVIQLARQRAFGSVCIDELRGRRVARSVGLRVFGSLAILMRMKSHRLIAEIRPALQKMISAGFHVSDELIAKVLRDAKEDAIE